MNVRVFRFPLTTSETADEHSTRPEENDMCPCPEKSRLRKARIRDRALQLFEGFHEKHARARRMPIALTLAEANLVLAAAVRNALDMKISIAASVCDAEGCLIAFQRMDGIYSDSIRMAIGKAIAAVASKASSGDESAPLDIRSVWSAAGTGLPIIRRPGGLPIARSGTVLGAIGVNGAATDNGDEQCAKTAIEAWKAFWTLP